MTERDRAVMEASKGEEEHWVQLEQVRVEVVTAEATRLWEEVLSEVAALEQALADAQRSVRDVESKLEWAEARGAESAAALSRAAECTEKLVQESRDEAISSLMAGFYARFVASREEARRQSLVDNRVGFWKGYEYGRAMYNLAYPDLQAVVVPRTREEWGCWQVADGAGPPESQPPTDAGYSKEENVDADLPDYISPTPPS